jgi:hypothetical protein
MVEPAGRYASCLRSPLVVERRPLNFQLDADHSSLSGLHDGDRLFLAVAASSLIPSPDRFGPPNRGRFGIPFRGSSPQ